MANIITQYGGNPYQRLVDMARLTQQKGGIKGIPKVGKIYRDLLKDLNLEAGKVPLLAGENRQCRSDRLHFTPAGYRGFGKRYAETMLQLV